MNLKQLKNKLLILSDKELIEYIETEFTYSNSIGNFNNNLNTLCKLNPLIRKVAISRMKKIEDLNDNSKSLPSLVTMILALLAALSSFYNEIFSGIIPQTLISIVVLGLFFSLIATLLGKSRREKATAFYFRSLLEGIEQNENQS